MASPSLQAKQHSPPRSSLLLSLSPDVLSSILLSLEASEILQSAAATCRALREIATSDDTLIALCKKLVRESGRVGEEELLVNNWLGLVKERSPKRLLKILLRFQRLLGAWSAQELRPRGGLLYFTWSTSPALKLVAYRVIPEWLSQGLVCIRYLEVEACPDGSSLLSLYSDSGMSLNHHPGLTPPVSHLPPLPPPSQSLGLSTRAFHAVDVLWLEAEKREFCLVLRSAADVSNRNPVVRSSDDSVRLGASNLLARDDVSNRDILIQSRNTDVSNRIAVNMSMGNRVLSGVREAVESESEGQRFDVENGGREGREEERGDGVRVGEEYGEEILEEELMQEFEDSEEEGEASLFSSSSLLSPSPSLSSSLGLHSRALQYLGLVANEREEERGEEIGEERGGERVEGQRSEESRGEGGFESEVTENGGERRGVMEGPSFPLLPPSSHSQHSTVPSAPSVSISLLPLAAGSSLPLSSPPSLPPSLVPSSRYKRLCLVPELGGGPGREDIREARDGGTPSVPSFSSSISPTLSQSLPYSLLGLWMGLYGPHGLEVILLSLEPDDQAEEGGEEGGGSENATERVERARERQGERDRGSREAEGRRRDRTVLVATKVLGDPNVPSNEITFKAFLDSERECGEREEGSEGGIGREGDERHVETTREEQERYSLGKKFVRRWDGLGRIAGHGFVNPEWVPGQMLVDCSGSLWFHWNGRDLSFATRFKRLHLEEVLRGSLESGSPALSFVPV